MLQNGITISRWTLLQNEKRKCKAGYFEDGWICRCNCDKATVRWVKSESLRNGRSKSCGCLIKELSAERMTTHGCSRTKEYKCYHSMMARCYDKTHRSFKYYGGREDNPIKVCDRWHNIANFLSDAKLLDGYRPGLEGLSLDRVNSDLDYSPENCRWSSNVIQQNNKRNNIRVVFNGETLTIAELARLEEVKYSKLIDLYDRYKNRMSIEDIVSRLKCREASNLAKIARDNNVSYSRLYRLHKTRGLTLEESLSKLKS